MVLQLSQLHIRKRAWGESVRKDCIEAINTHMHAGVRYHLRSDCVDICQLRDRGADRSLVFSRRLSHGRGCREDALQYLKMSINIEGSKEEEKGTSPDEKGPSEAGVHGMIWVEGLVEKRWQCSGHDLELAVHHRLFEARGTASEFM